MRILSLAALLTLAACASAPDRAAAPEAAFDAARLSQHIRTLSDDSFEGRGVATPAEHKTVRYISEQFAAAGLQPGGENGGWTQAVTLNRFTVTQPQARITAGEWSRDWTPGRDVVVSTRLPSQRIQLQAAPLIFVGYGVKAPERQWDDFKDQDMSGKVLVVLVNDPDFEAPEANTFGGRTMTYYGRWTYKYEEAARQGAAGVIIVHEDAPASYGWATVINSWTGPQFDIVRQNAAAERIALESWITRDAAVELFRQAGQDFEALKVAARSPDFQPVALNATLDVSAAVATDRITTHNVIGRLPGTTHPNETVIYGGHWDHIGVGEPDANGDAIFNGAVDNASGIAGLLELARVWGAGPRPERSVVFIAFTAEESGLLGSEYYGANPLYPLEKTAGGFNMDSMNVYGRKTAVRVTGYGQSELDELVEAAATAQGRTLQPDLDNTGGTYFRSDHFSLAKRGVPMAYLSSGGDFRDEPIAARQAAQAEYGARRYHQADDEWSPEWDYRGQIEDLALIYSIGRELANSRDWPEWKPGSEFAPARAVSACARH